MSKTSIKKKELKFLFKKEEAKNFNQKNNKFLEAVKIQVTVFYYPNTGIFLSEKVSYQSKTSFSLLFSFSNHSLQSDPNILLPSECNLFVCEFFFCHFLLVIFAV
jgi:hypothetical protein